MEIPLFVESTDHVSYKETPGFSSGMQTSMGSTFELNCRDQGVNIMVFMKFDERLSNGSARFIWYILHKRECIFYTCTQGSFYSTHDPSRKLIMSLCTFKLTPTLCRSIICYSPEEPSSKLIYSSPNLLLHSVAPLHVTLPRNHLVSSFTHSQTYFYTLSLHYMLLCPGTI